MPLQHNLVLPSAAIRRVRLLAEAALLRRFNAGVGFADARLPSQMFCRDPEVNLRIGSGLLRSADTHRKASDTVTALLAVASAARQQESSRLDRLAQCLSLDAVSRDLVDVCLAWETDLDTRELISALAGRKLELMPLDCVVDVLGPEHAAAIVLAVQLGAPLRVARVLRFEGEGLSAGLALRSSTLRWLLNDDTLPPPLAGLCELVEIDQPIAVWLPTDIAAALTAWSGSADVGQLLLALRGPKGSGRRAAAVLCATAMHKRLLIVPVAALLTHERQLRVALFADIATTAALFDAVVYFADIDVLAGTPTEGDAGQQEFAVAQVAKLISQHRGPAIVSAAARAPMGLLDRPVQEIVMPPADLETRIAAFEFGLRLARSIVVPEATMQYAPELGARYVLGVGAIGEILDEAAQHAALLMKPLEPEFIEAAVARRLSLRLGSYGSIVPRKAKFNELIVPDDVVESLHDMIAMVRQRSKILETWGFARHLGISRGVSALFSGEPGTGKTMAASVVASTLGLELIRIDLSAVVSKYVGETEKNLSRIFDQAQQSHAMLLFDEADSLFGKRTELRSAQDRFANLEVNYILQRMETFDGISILTTNAENAIDPALQRRLNFRIRFPAPEPVEREQLWRSLLPPATEVVDAVDFAALAERFEMTGGYIKNAIVRAAVFAARAGRGVMAEDIWNGAYSEYAEMGKVMPQLGGALGNAHERR